MLTWTGSKDVSLSNGLLKVTGSSTQAEALVDTPVTPSRSSASVTDDLHLIAVCETSPAALEQLAGEWRELFERIGCSNVFLSAEWMTTWWRHFGGTQRLLLVTVRLPSGQLIAVAPFYVRRSFLGPWGPRALCFLANTSVGSDYLTILVDPDYHALAIHAIVRLVDRHRTEWDYIELSDTEAESPIFRQLQHEFQSRGMSERILRTYICKHTVLPRSFDEYLASHSVKGRRKFRQLRKALEGEGVRFVTLEDNLGLHWGFEELVRLHRLRFAHKAKPSWFLLPAVQAFHRALLWQMAAKGRARIFLLQRRGRAIAALYGFSVGKKFIGYQLGWDPVWSRLNPGRVMIFCAIEDAIRSGHDEYDFKGGRDTYKVQWVNGARRVQTVCFFNNRFKSRWASAQVWVKKQAEQVKQLVRSSSAAERMYAQAVRWLEQMERLVRSRDHAQGCSVAPFSRPSLSYSDAEEQDDAEGQDMSAGNLSSVHYRCAVTRKGWL